MKKTLILLLAILLCFLSACTSRHIKKDVYVYVVYVDDTGFVCQIEDVGDVYVKCPTGDYGIKTFDTVIMTYDLNAITESGGTYIPFEDHEATYDHTLESVRAIRIADPGKGEPVFG